MPLCLVAMWLGPSASVLYDLTVLSTQPHSASATWSLTTLSPSLLLLLLLSSQQPGADPGENPRRIAILKMNKLAQRSGVAHSALSQVKSPPCSASSESIQPSVTKSFLKPHPLSCFPDVFPTPTEQRSHGKPVLCPQTSPTLSPHQIDCCTHQTPLLQ